MFCSLIKGITLKIRILCFVLINSILRVWILFAILKQIKIIDVVFLPADLHVLAEDGTIAGEAGMDDDDLTTAEHIREQSMIDQESSFEVQVSQWPWWCR